MGRSRVAQAAGDAVATGRRGIVPVALGVTVSALMLSGCESTQERSAELRGQAKHDVLAAQSASVHKESASVEVVQSTVVHSSGGSAVVVALRNTSTHTLENAPIEITVRDAHGGVLFQNNQPGLEPSLTRISLLPPGAQTTWVDDQVETTGVPASASALVGEGVQASGSIPQLNLTGAHLSAETGNEATLSGTVTNRSQTAQQNLVVYAVARRGSKIVAAGRAVLPEVPAGTNSATNVPFQIYFVGDPSGAQIQTSAPATTF
ncbi:MAG TPA: hypothetical protein VIJ39_02350 [Solirubrobacteraceae bacterium]